MEEITICEQIVVQRKERKNVNFSMKDVTCHCQCVKLQKKNVDYLLCIYQIFRNLHLQITSRLNMGFVLCGYFYLFRSLIAEIHDITCIEAPIRFFISHGQQFT